MSDTAKFSLFNITACGYYKYRLRTPEFCGLSETLADLKKWSNSKPLFNTKTYEVEDGEDLHPAYLMDIRQSSSSNDDWLLTIWNQTADNQTGVSAVDGSSSVGNATIVTNGVPLNSIAGFATYFWINCKENILANVRFSNSKTCQKELKKYIKSYLECWSSKVVHDSSSVNEIVILGYRDNASQLTNMKIYPRFSTSQINNPGKNEYIKANSHLITKVIRKATLLLSQQADLKLYQHLLQKAHITKPTYNTQEIPITYNLKDKIEEKDINDMISDWKESESHGRTWDDYGFQFKGKPDILWLSQSKARGNIDLNVKWKNPEQIDPASLLNEIVINKSKILKLKE